MIMTAIFGMIGSLTAVWSWLLACVSISICPSGKMQLTRSMLQSLFSQFFYFEVSTFLNILLNWTSDSGSFTFCQPPHPSTFTKVAIFRILYTLFRLNTWFFAVFTLQEFISFSNSFLLTKENSWLKRTNLGVKVYRRKCIYCVSFKKLNKTKRGKFFVTWS